MAQQKGFAHRPGAFAKRPVQQTTTFVPPQQPVYQQQVQPQQAQPQQPAYQPQPQPQPQNPGFNQQMPPGGAAPEFGTDAYYAYVQQQANANFVANQGARNMDEALRMEADYVNKLRSQYDEANDCVKFNTTTEEALRNRAVMDELNEVLKNDDLMMSGKPMLDTIDKFRWMIGQVITSLRDPTLWIPEEYAIDKYIIPYKTAGEALSASLEKYSQKLTLMQDTVNKIRQEKARQADQQIAQQGIPV